ncbi:MAG: penicillin-binding protein 1A [Wenzhouxiangella sp.]|jgi:penicillin-binding protein 1A|nr:penicillin-binding protein 1A [Wenzhouxiangella sp.]
MFAFGLIGLVVLWLIIVPSLPSVDSLRDVRLQVPLRIYSADEQLMLEVGEQRRIPAAIDEIPERLRLAFLAAEDDRFYRHPGIDWRGTLRGAWLYAWSLGRGRVPGGSTITQQVARRFFLSTEYSVTRKLREMLLALKIERQMSKDEIFELYLNKEFLGHRAYGVGAAAQVYYGKTLDELSLAEMAMIAALPKAPSRDNPLSGPRQAMIRRNWVLDRMLLLEYVSPEEHAAARAEPNRAEFHGPVRQLDADWIAEMARQSVVDRLGAEEAYGGGYRAYTTIISDLQTAADAAVRNGLQAYDRRHGWRGPEQRLAEETLTDPALIEATLAQVRPVADLVPAVVVESGEAQASLIVRGGESVSIDLDSLSWAREHLALDALGPQPGRVDEVLQVGDLVRLRSGEDGWMLAQIPKAEAALVAMEAETGAILALVGGLDFGRSQFNRATLSQRQPGSAFKPFVYAAAFDNGYSPASIVNDAPVVVDDPSMERVWRPTNFSRRFHGPTRLREAMIHSRNLVSVRLLMGMGLETTRSYMSRFGFKPAELPAGPSMALGSASITPLELTTAYAVFANGGYAVEPQFLDRVEDREGRLIMDPVWTLACPDCPEPPDPSTAPGSGEADPGSNGAAPISEPRRLDLNAVDDGLDEASDRPPEFVGPTLPNAAEQVVSTPTAWLVRTLLSDVVRSGTGRRALAIGRSDLAGKTGTTNDLRDTWFAGFGGGIVTTVWLGMDNNESLGRQEQGGRTALPLWVDFMEEALAGRPEMVDTAPVGVTRALINPETGLRAHPEMLGAIEEWFHADNLPPFETLEESESESDPYDIF